MSAPEVLAARLHGQVLAPAGSKLVLAEWVAPGSVGEQPHCQAPLHLHQEDEAWYVLAGTLRVRVGDDQVEVPAGGAAIVPGGVAHTFWNPSPQPARYVLVMGGKDPRPHPGPACQRRPEPSSPPAAVRGARRQAHRVARHVRWSISASTVPSGGLNYPRGAA